VYTVINVVEWAEISRIAVVNCMVAGGELIGFGLVFAAFLPLLRFLKEENKDLRETLKVMRDKDV